MKTSMPRPLPLAAALALSLALVAPMAASAQEVGSSGSTMRQQREKRMKELRGESGEAKQQAQQAEAAPLYPEATRTAPDAQAKGKSFQTLQALQKQYEADDYAGVLAKAPALAASAGSAYEKAFAYQLAGAAASASNNDAKAAEYFKAAVDANGLDNNTHYTAMYNLAVLQYQLEQYPAALATIDRFLAETKSAKPEHLGFRAGILAGAGRNDEAAKAYRDLLAKNPTDKKLLMNAVAALQNADQNDQAAALLADARGKGLLDSAAQYRALYVSQLNQNKDKDAIATLREAQAKGLLEQPDTLSKDYQVIAQRAYAAQDVKTAIEFYQLAAPIASNGEAWLNLAKVYKIEGQPAKAREAAQQALAKGGLKNPAEAQALAGGK